MALDAETIGRAIDVAGFDASTTIVVGVRSREQTTVVSRGSDVDEGGLGDAVGYAGSLAKQLTAACAALLAREGALDLDAPIAGLLPELPAWADEVRARQLIHHTAGLPSTGAVWERMRRDGEQDWTSDGALAALSTVTTLDRPPGSAFAYSNVGYVCLGRILERSLGEPLADIARRRLFDPLGMAATSFWSGPAPSPPAARLAPPAGRPLPLSVGDGGLWTTMRDLLRWNDALLEDRLGLTARLHSPGVLDDGTLLDYAWGVRVSHESGTRVESHGGSWEASTAKLVRLPELGGGFAALATGGGVARMVALSSTLQHALLEPRGGRS